MTDFIQVGKILDKLTESEQEFGEFKETILSMVGNKMYETDMLKTFQHLYREDLYEKVSTLQQAHASSIRIDHASVRGLSRPLVHRDVNPQSLFSHKLTLVASWNSNTAIDEMEFEMRNQRGSSHNYRKMDIDAADEGEYVNKNDEQHTRRYVQRLRRAKKHRNRYSRDSKLFATYEAMGDINSAYNKQKMGRNTGVKLRLRPDSFNRKN